MACSGRRQALGETINTKTNGRHHGQTTQEHRDYGDQHTGQFHYYQWLIFDCYIVNQWSALMLIYKFYNRVLLLLWIISLTLVCVLDFNLPIFCISETFYILQCICTYYLQRINDEYLSVSYYIMDTNPILLLINFSHAPSVLSNSSVKES